MYMFNVLQTHTKNDQNEQSVFYETTLFTHQPGGGNTEHAQTQSRL